MAVKGLSKIDPRFSNFISTSLASGYAAENILDYLRERMSPEGDKMESQRLEQGAQSGNQTSQERVALTKRRSESGLGKGLGAAIGLASGIGGLGGQEATQGMTQQQASPGQMQQEQPPPPPENKNPISILSQFSPELSQFVMGNIEQGRQPREAAVLAYTTGKFNKIIQGIQKSTGQNFEDFLEGLFGSQTQPQQGQIGQMQNQQGPGIDKVLNFLQTRRKK